MTPGLSSIWERLSSQPGKSINCIDPVELALELLGDESLTSMAVFRLLGADTSQIRADLQQLLSSSPVE